MQYSFPDGLTETCISTILKQALCGLQYFHDNGWLHRDVKAANLLVDEDGTVLLADFGVSSLIGNKQKGKLNDGSVASRKSFVGTPNWMAPEIVQQKESYDLKGSFSLHYCCGTSYYCNTADIWSFGITGIELSLGRAPHAFFNAATALQKTVLETSPSIDRENGANKYSKAFKEMVDLCTFFDLHSIVKLISIDRLEERSSQKVRLEGSKHLLC